MNFDLYDVAHTDWDNFVSNTVTRWFHNGIVDNEYQLLNAWQTRCASQNIDNSVAENLFDFDEIMCQYDMCV